MFPYVPLLYPAFITRFENIVALELEAPKRPTGRAIFFIDEDMQHNDTDPVLVDLTISRVFRIK